MTTIRIFALLVLLPSIVRSQQSGYKKYAPCFFSIMIPTHMKLKKTGEGWGYCDAEVFLSNGRKIFDIHSLSRGRFEYNTIDEFYRKAVNASELDITYKMKSSDFFVISGYNPKNGRVVYWKRAMGSEHISDLWIEYEAYRRSEIKTYLSTISKSFRSY